MSLAFRTYKTTVHSLAQQKLSWSLGHWVNEKKTEKVTNS